MTQAQIIDYLKEHGPATMKEMAKKIGITYSSVRDSVAAMRKYNEVKKVGEKHTVHGISYVFDLNLEDRKKVAQLEFKKRQNTSKNPAA